MPDIPPLTPHPGRRPRAKTAERGYGAEHRKFRTALLALHPVCQRCNNAWATQAHHLRYPATCLEDYEALCVQCHARQH
jgi:hypothetical protein